jgi:hypothetical protein
MRNTRKIINIILVALILVCVFLIVRFDVFKRIEDATVSQVEERKASSNNDDEEEFKYETFIDEEGNEVVLDFECIVIIDEQGNKKCSYDENYEQNTFYYTYYGTIERIEDNKIYFLVDKKSKENSYFCDDVNDYQIILSNYKIEVESFGELGFYGTLFFNYKIYSSVDDLKFSIGEYLRLQISGFKYPNSPYYYEFIDFYFK